VIPQNQKLDFTDREEVILNENERFLKRGGK
jgi:hypothetical protein